MSAISTSSGEGSMRSSRRPDSIRCQARRGARSLMAKLARQRAAGLVTAAIDEMIVDHAGRLHEGVDDGRPDEIAAHARASPWRWRARRRSRRHVLQAHPRVVDRASVDEAPQMTGEAALVREVENDAGQRHRRLDLGPVADDAGVLHQRVLFLVAPAHDLLGVEAVERLAEGRALAQDGDPGESGLEAVEHELLEHRPIVVFGHAPFLVMIGDIERIDARPGAARQSVRVLDRRHDARRLLFIGHERFSFCLGFGLVFPRARGVQASAPRPFDRPGNLAHRLPPLHSPTQGHEAHDVSRHSSRQDRRRAGRQARRDGRVRADGGRRDHSRHPFDRQLQGRAGAQRQVAGHPPLSDGARRRSRRNRRELEPVGLCSRRPGHPDRDMASARPITAATPNARG